jgi:hypothetical protein
MPSDASKAVVQEGCWAMAKQKMKTSNNEKTNCFIFRLLKKGFPTLLRLETL